MHAIFNPFIHYHSFFGWNCRNNNIYITHSILSSINSLNIDAKSAQAWRAKGFHPVLAEGAAATPLQNLQGSVLYQMLRLKQLHPQPRVGMLSEDLDLGLDRAQVCTTEAGFDSFARQHPRWGMP